MKSLRNLSCCLLVAILSFSCSDAKVEDTTTTNTDSDVVKSEITLDAPMLAILAQADALDGETDKVVKKCAGCALGMMGKPDYVTEVSGYSLQHCTEGCRDAYGKDLKTNLGKLKIPGMKIPETKMPK